MNEEEPPAQGCTVRVGARHKDGTFSLWRLVSIDRLQALSEVYLAVSTETGHPPVVMLSSIEPQDSK